MAVKNGKRKLKTLPLDTEEALVYSVIETKTRRRAITATLYDPKGGNTMEDNTPDILTLEDEAGKEHVFEVIDAADYEGVHYLAVVPYIETEEEAEAALAEDADLIIMRVGEEDGEEYLDIVDDDEEFYNVGEIFARRLSEIYDVEGSKEGMPS